VLRRALDASEGNPLFLRELLRLLVDDGVLVRDEHGRWTLTVEVDAIQMPASIHAALAARIEQLQPDERAVLQAASVIGRHFPRGAVAALLPPTVAARLDDLLTSLHRRALVDPEGTWWVDERLFRFHHVLIRDAAYRRVLKEVRADQHVRYADWLIERVGDATAEHDEVLAFHLEQALTYRADLGQPIESAVVDRAVAHLAAAGRRALDGDDLHNAAALLRRALELKPSDPDLLRDRCEALVAGGDVHAATEAVAELMTAAHDDPSRAIAAVFDAQLAGQRTPGALRDVAARTATAAAVLAAAGDDSGVAQAESAHATALAGLGQVAACEEALDRSLVAARRAGDTRRANAVLAIAPAAALWGPSTSCGSCASRRGRPTSRPTRCATKPCSKPCATAPTRRVACWPRHGRPSPTSGTVSACSRRRCTTASSSCSMAPPRRRRGRFASPSPGSRRWAPTATRRGRRRSSRGR
jgi:predicted ATPase